MRTSKIPCEKNKVLLTRVSLHSIRYPDPAIKVNDTVKVETATGKILDYVKFDTGVVIMATGGRNMGRVGVVTHRERHDGGFNIVHVKDAIDNTFATRESNVFVIGQDKPWVSLPKGKGVKVCYLRKLYVHMNHANSFRSSPLLRSVTAAVPTLSPTKCLLT
jgi:ribosomal protein S4E